MYEGPYVIDDPHTPRFRVHRSAMVDPDILEQERAKVFDRSWLYVDHESDIAKPHEFRTRSVGGRPIIFVRSTDGAIGVFVNSCPHAGMQIETRPEGQGRFLKCFYHGWTFNTAGALVALPDEESYGPNFDRENLCLVRPPRVSSYHGFVFLSWTNDIEDLETYLAGAADVLDSFADQSEVGMRVIHGSHVYAAHANWKLLSENSYDGYHALTTHHRYLAILKTSGKDLQQVFCPGGRPALGWDLGNGHAAVGGSDGSGGRGSGLGRDLSEAALVKQIGRRDRFAELYGEDWEEWLERFTPNATDVVPTTDCRTGDPAEDLFFVRDDFFLLSQRVAALVDGTALTENPHSTTHRMVSNVRAREDGHGEVEAKANLLVRRGQGPGRLARTDASRVGPRRGAELGRRTPSGPDRRLRPHPRRARDVRPRPDPDLGRRPVRELPRRPHPAARRAGLPRPRDPALRRQDRQGVPELLERVARHRAHHQGPPRRRSPAHRRAARGGLRRPVRLPAGPRRAAPPRLPQHGAVPRPRTRRLSMADRVHADQLLRPQVVAAQGGWRPFGTELDLDPPSPAPWRLMDVGAAVARVLRPSPWRVTLIASSSWSHAFLTDHTWRLRPDTAADRQLYDAMIANDLSRWEKTTTAEIEHTGQQEVPNWFTPLGVARELGVEPAWSTFVETWVFNSNKVFAVWPPAS
jgi:nitrite reductase/ring-hydroxylating ferredoxin subunit